MIMKSKAAESFSLFLAALLLLPTLALPTGVAAKTKTSAIEGMSYNVNSSLIDNLKLLVGKKVSVTLNSGKVFVGRIKDIGSHLVHLEKLDGKDHFDALIRIQDIGAIDARFRKIER